MIKDDQARDALTRGIVDLPPIRAVKLNNCISDLLNKSRKIGTASEYEIAYQLTTEDPGSTGPVGKLRKVSDKNLMNLLRYDTAQPGIIFGKSVGTNQDVVSNSGTVTKWTNQHTEMQGSQPKVPTSYHRAAIQQPTQAREELG